MPSGMDYAFAHPNLDCAVGKGVSFVARYIGDPDPNPLKYLDLPELGQLRSRGLSVVACRETTAGFMFTDSGDTHARISRHHLRDLGMHDAPVFYACDVDFRGLTQRQKDAGTEFLRDAARVDGGRDFVGLYGSDDAIDYWVGTDFCRWGWQTYAWSSGRVSPKAHFRQYLNGQNFCGGIVDYNETYADDFGQWPRPTGQPPTPEKPKDRDMYFLIKGAEKPEVYVTNLFDKFWLWSQDVVNIYMWMIRANGGIIVANDDNTPQVWDQDHVDSLRTVPTPGSGPDDQALDFVKDPEGKDGVWLVLFSSHRWFIDTSDDEGKTVLSHTQNHWAARGYDTAIKDWSPQDLLRIPITGSASAPPAGPVAWPAEGSVVGKITFTE